MKRDMQKLIDEYNAENLSEAKSSALFISDVEQLREISGGDPYKMLHNTFKAAYIIGRRAGGR